MSDQHRDNWSRETVRALRKKIKNLQHQINVRDWSIQARKQHISYWIIQATRAERDRSDTAVELYRTTQALQRALVENAQLKTRLGVEASRCTP